MKYESLREFSNIADLKVVIWRRKWIFIIPLLVVVVIAYAGTYSIAPQFESLIIIRMGNTMPLSDQMRSLIGNLPNDLQDEWQRSDELKALQNEVISTPLIRELVARLNLYKSRDLEKEVGKVAASHPNLPIEEIQMDIISDKLWRQIEVSFNGWDQIKLSVVAADPGMAHEMAQALGELLIDERNKWAMASTHTSLEFSSEQLAKYDEELKQKIDERTNIEKQSVESQTNNPVLSDSNRKAIAAQIEEAETEIESKKGQEISLLAKLTDIPLNRLSLSESQDLVKMKKDAQNFLGTVSTLMSNYCWNDPRILNFKMKLYDHIDNIKAENRRLVDEQFASFDSSARAVIVQLVNIRADLDMLYAETNEFKLAQANLAAGINAFLERQAKLDQLNREIDAARDLRDRLKGQQQGSEISQALLGETKWEVVEPASVPLMPIRSSRVKIIIMLTILGVVIGAGAVLVVERMDSTLRNIEDIEESTGLSVLAVIPEIRSIRGVDWKK